MNASIKEELHRLVDKCDNEVLLEEAKSILETNAVTDWWDELTEEDKSLVLESEVQYGKGDFISHKDILQQFETLRKN